MIGLVGAKTSEALRYRRSSTVRTVWRKVAHVNDVIILNHAKVKGGHDLELTWSRTDRWQKSDDSSHIFLHFLPTALDVFALGRSDSDHVGLQESGEVWFRVVGVVYTGLIFHGPLPLVAVTHKG